MRIRIKAPDGKMIRHIPTERLYSEVVCDERKRNQYVLADSEEDPVIEYLDGITLGDRVTDLEDAVVELAEIITEVENG